MGRFVRILYLTFVVLLGNIGTGWCADIKKGINAYNDGDFATALREFKALAEQGNVVAQFNLGLMYAEGKGVPQDDMASVNWFLLAANRGNTSAQVNLGFMYQYGKGVTKNEEEAVRWYRFAAEQGHVNAQVNLGLMYRSGKGVIKDYVSSHMWWSLAALQGDLDARERRDRIAEKMTPFQIETSQHFARECLAQNYKDC